jgi:hypothetical protein
VAEKPHDPTRLPSKLTGYRAKDPSAEIVRRDLRRYGPSVGRSSGQPVARPAADC